MQITITGICGFVGSTLARELSRSLPEANISGIDNLSRPGSERNLRQLRKEGFEIVEGDIRRADDLAKLSKPEWIVDAAANPSVLAGVDGQSSSREVLDHNLVGTIELLEWAKANSATFTLLSTSRVYAIDPLTKLELSVKDEAFAFSDGPTGVTSRGIDESFSTDPPLSLYGSSKKASELLALEYGSAFDFPVWINRCGLMAGAGQFGKADQGILAFWLHRYHARLPLQYIGFGGTGHQVRDALHPRDLVGVLVQQFETGLRWAHPRTCNFSGGQENAISLRRLSDWCADRFGKHEVLASKEERPFDLPWVVLDSSRAEKLWDWRPATSLDAMLEEIAIHAEENPHWLELSSPSST